LVRRLAALVDRRAARIGDLGDEWRARSSAAAGTATSLAAMQLAPNALTPIDDSDGDPPFNVARHAQQLVPSGGVDYNALLATATTAPAATTTTTPAGNARALELADVDAIPERELLLGDVIGRGEFGDVYAVRADRSHCCLV
jgi:hypothetical protein